MHTTTTTTGREYLRVSQDRSGRARSVDEQHDDNQRAATTRGITLGKPYADTSVSASRYTTKTRDDFTNLLSDLEKGRFGADELWLWEPSRGSRRVSEWVLLIEACERAGVLIFVTTHARTYDPANARDRRSLLEDAVDSEYESSKVSTRSKRAAAANAAAGLPHGPTAFGYRRIYDPLTKRLVRQEPHPDEAPVVRELFDRLRAGHSLRSIATDFEARGITTRPRGRNGETIPGKPFSPQHLRVLALTAHYVGLRVHTPRVRNGQRASDTLRDAVKGVWEPLVDEETFHAVKRLLSAPERKTNRTGRAVHLLSLIAVCDVCGAGLAVTRRADRKGSTVRRELYQCRKRGCVKIDKAELDTLAETFILGLLADPDVFDRMEAEGHDDVRLRQVRNDLATAEADLDELRRLADPARTPRAHLISVTSFAALEPGYVARVETLQAQKAELESPSGLRDLIAPGDGVRDRWDTTPISAKRKLARALLAPEWLGELRVARRPRDAGNRRVPADQRVTWRQAE